MRVQWTRASTDPSRMEGDAFVTDATTLDLRPERFATGVPFDDLRWLRDNAPAWWSPAMACWVVTSYELVEKCNRDYVRFSSSDGVVDPADAGAPKWKPITGLDPPEHGRYRRLVMAPFTPIPIGRLEDMVRGITREAIATFIARRRRRFRERHGLYGSVPRHGDVDWRSAGRSGPDCRMDEQCHAQCGSGLSPHGVNGGDLPRCSGRLLSQSGSGPAHR